MILDELVEEKFFDGWKGRFESNWQKYITPEDKRVKKWANEVETRAFGDKGKAKEAHKYVYRNTEYKLSKKWKTPRQTIRSGIGDCEDLTFLVGSMLPGAGVESHELHLGKIRFPSGESDYHTWSQVGDVVVDATGSRESTKRIEYKTETKWEIESIE